MNGDVPLTLAPSPETLDGWNTLAAKQLVPLEGPAAIRSARASGNHQVLTGPFVPLDLPSILDGGLSGVVNPELARGFTTLETFFGPNLDLNPSTALPGPLDPVALRTLQIASARQLVVDGTQLTPVDGEVHARAHPYKMQTVPGDDASAVTVVGDRSRSAAVPPGRRPAGPARRAPPPGLALVAGEQPSIMRGVAITNPDRWDADDTFVAATLAGLRGNPLLRPTTVAGLFDAVPAATVDGEPDGAPVYRQLAPYDAAGPAGHPRPVCGRRGSPQRGRRVRRHRPPGDDRRRPGPGVVGVGRLGHTRRARRRRVACSPRSARRSTGSSNQIEVQSQGTITITSSKAEIPISFKNTSDQDVTVHVKLESDRLLFPDGAEREVVAAQGAQHHRAGRRSRPAARAPLPSHMTVTANGLPIPGGAHDDRGPLHLRERCGSLPDRGRDRVPRDLVGLGHPPSSQEALADATAPDVPPRAAVRATGVSGGRR